MTSNRDLVGRDEVKRLEEIFGISKARSMPCATTLTCSPGDDKGERPALIKLYEKAKTSQWNGETDLPWHLDVDREKLAEMQAAQFGFQQMDLSGTPFETWGDKEWLELGIESQNYGEMSSAELQHRVEFAFEAAVRMRDRFLQQEVWERMGVDPKVAIPLAQQSPFRAGTSSRSTRERTWR